MFKSKIKLNSPADFCGAVFEKFSVVGVIFCMHFLFIMVKDKFQRRIK